MVFPYIVSSKVSKMDLAAEFPNLDQFIGCYFHQDWTIDAEERGDITHPDYAILHAFKDVNAAYLLAIKEDIDKLLARQYTEVKLLQIIEDEFCGNINPSLDGLTMQRWLEHVCQMINDALLGFGSSRLPR